jgi:7-cyano-7-deazaguanine reductase
MTFQNLYKGSMQFTQLGRRLSIRPARTILAVGKKGSTWYIINGLSEKEYQEPKTMKASDHAGPELLKTLSRALQREQSGLRDPLPFWGVDIWNAYEISWLRPNGKPQVALGCFFFPADSPNLIESKSFKFYLNSFNQILFENNRDFEKVLEEDLGEASGSSVRVILKLPISFPVESLKSLDGESLDELGLETAADYLPEPDFLEAQSPIVEETLTSNLLKTNCPLTGQPDWASIQIRYRGPQIQRQGLLRYLISFRTYRGFHEDCVERIFSDIQKHCGPEKLSVYARYTRRGGLDINPFRTNFEKEIPSNTRTPRQ